MKKLITIAIFALAIQGAFAQRGQSILNIRLSNGAPFRLAVDGRQFGGVSKTATIPNLSLGDHFIEVFAVGNSWRSRGRNFKGRVNIGRNTESFATVYPEYGRIKIDRVLALNTPGWDDRDHFLPGHPQPNVPEPCGTVDLGPYPMNPADFSTLKQTISNGNFESTRLNIFKQALPYNYFTSAQVREVMNLFWFESTKLEVAKLAYTKTVDPNNYYTVNNGFNFSSSVNQLSDYIAMR